MVVKHFSFWLTKKRKIIRQQLFYLQIILFLFLFFNFPLKIKNQPISQISLIIKGTGEQRLIKDRFSAYISKVLVEEEEKACLDTCNLNLEINNVIIQFTTGITSCAEMFECRTNIKEINLAQFDTSQVTEMNSMFKGCSILEKITFGNINTNLVTNMEKFCEDCILLKSIDLSNLDISNVKKIDFIFSGCHELQTITFGTTTVVLDGMISAFNHCHSLKSINLSPFDTSRVRNMDSLFDNCYSLEEINFGNIDTSSVETMSGMFSGCSSLISIDLSKFNTAKVRNMAWMFNACSSLTELSIGNLDISSVVNMYYTFNGCSQLVSLDLSNWNFAKLEVMTSTFSGCSKLKNIYLGDSTSPCLREMVTTFQGCNELISVDFSHFDLTHVINTNAMFDGCTSLIDVKFGSSSTPSLEQMGKMFNNCEKIKTIDLSNFDFSKVSNMLYTFFGCKQLLSVNFGNINTPSLLEVQGLFQSCENLPEMDLSGFDFSKVKSIEALFHSCYNLVNVKFGNMPTSSLENMRQTFFCCHALKSVDLSSFDFRKVISMEETFMLCSNIINIQFGNSPTSSLQNMFETFRECANLKSVDISSFDFTKVTEMKCLFFQCWNLQEVNFGNSPTDSLESMNQIFQDCPSLKSADLSNFRTSKVEEMFLLFCNCPSLEYVDVSSFDTSNVKNMANMFTSCPKLKNIDLSNFDTSKVTKITSMFYGCSGFRYLNLSNFLTPQVKEAVTMFKDSTGLFYLNLYNFVFDSSVQWEGIFDQLKPYVIYCINDAYTKNLILPINAFSFCSDSCYLFNYTKIDYYNQRCLDSCEKSDNTKFEYKGVCYLSCPSNTLMLGYLCIDNDIDEYNRYNIEYDDGNQPIGYYKDSNNVFKQCYDTCKYCDGEGIETNNNCRECKPNSRFLDVFDNDKNCYPECEFYYYFDTANKYHCTETDVCPNEFKKLIPVKKRCIDNCEKDDIYKYNYHDICLNIIINETTYIETTMIETTTMETTISETTHKEDTTSETTHKEDTTSEIIHKEDTTIGTTHFNIIEDSKTQTTHISILEDTTSGTTHYNEIKDTVIEITNSIGITDISNIMKTTSVGLLYECENDDTIINKCSIKNIANNTEKYNIIQSMILSSYSSDNFRSLFFQGEGGMIYQLTNAKNELSRLNNNDHNDNYNISIIDLGFCENLLKQHYGIAEQDSLIILKKEKISGKASEKSVEYDIYEPYNKTKLNLSICSGTNINIYVPIELSEDTKKMAEEMEELGYNIFDINDPFYRDYCTPYKSSGNTDVLLSDRIEHIYNNQDAKCQNNCKFSNYIVNTKFINCTCDVENQEEEENLEKKIDKMDAKTLGQSFYYVLKYSNYKILKCYKLVFVKDVLSKNKGGIIIFILFILYLCCLIWYICQGLNRLKKSLGFVFDENGKNGKFILYKNTVYFPPKKRKSSTKEKNKKSSKMKTSIIEPDNKTTQYKNESKRISSNSQIFDNSKSRGKTPRKHYSSTKEILKHNKDKVKSRKSKFTRKESENELVVENNLEKKYDDFELNELEYEEAIRYDQRSCFKIYFSLIKREHRIIFTFFVCNDYNLIPVKLSRFIFLLATDMCMNVFFFSDASMHKIYLNYGKYDFIQQIPQIIYSTVVSQMIEVFLCFLSLTDKHMYEIKNLEPDKTNNKVVTGIFNTMRRKLFFYFFITFIFFLGYWYIVAVFCAVYENTQIAFIKDSFMSSLLGILYPFVLYGFPAAFRGCALKCKNNNCLFKFSEIIPFF